MHARCFYRLRAESWQLRRRFFMFAGGNLLNIAMNTRGRSRSHYNGHPCVATWYLEPCGLPGSCEALWSASSITLFSFLIISGVDCWSCCAHVVYVNSDTNSTVGQPFCKARQSLITWDHRFLLHDLWRNDGRWSGVYFQNVVKQKPPGLAWLHSVYVYHGCRRFVADWQWLVWKKKILRQVVW